LSRPEARDTLGRAFEEKGVVRMGTKAIPIGKLPVEERPRERLVQFGPESLSLVELIAVLLGGGLRGEGALGLAFRLLERFGGLDGLARSSREEFQQVPGMGRARACQLAAALELGKRMGRTRPLPTTCISSPADVAALFMEQMRYLRQEHFKAAYLDTKHRVLKVETISIGSLNASVVHPREILRPAVATSAAAIVLVHNHPTGDPTPSSEDVAFTRRFAQCSELMGIKFLDHVIIGAGKYESLKEAGVF
jgi:DNA repair protein RadC